MLIHSLRHLKFSQELAVSSEWASRDKTEKQIKIISVAAVHNVKHG